MDSTTLFHFPFISCHSLHACWSHRGRKETAWSWYWIMNWRKPILNHLDCKKNKIYFDSYRSPSFNDNNIGLIHFKLHVYNFSLISCHSLHAWSSHRRCSRRETTWHWFWIENRRRLVILYFTRSKKSVGYKKYKI